MIRSVKTKNHHDLALFFFFYNCLKIASPRGNAPFLKTSSDSYLTMRGNRKLPLILHGKK
ncbi:MAG: hypothetical protein ACJAT7_000395 [Psychromonas sp.]|jgi:hypothetical protein